ncbi:MAG: VWA domain-containing protein [Sulfurovum sp.]
MRNKTLILASILIISTLTAMEAPVLPDILKPNKVIDPIKVPSTFKRTGPTIQIGILLDTSSSMSGLINQAKEQLWKIINEVAKANKYKKDVVIQVGLFEYGKSSLPEYEGFLQLLSPLTSDLDKVSDVLFKLHTNGGEEYAGKVILESVNRFVWSDNKDDLKLLIIAGNESFAQGNVPYIKAIKKARANDIIINTIFCGDANKGVRLSWKKGARLGGGKYFNINHNTQREYIATPYDDEIISLGNSLNYTYINYGSKKERRAKTANTFKQDNNAKGLSKNSYIERNIVKSKKQYTEASSDMVTAYMNDAPSIKKISKEELPQALQGKTSQEIKQIIEEKRDKRVTLQKKIKKLEGKRDKFISKANTTDDKDLGTAIIKSIRKQAIESGFIFKK